MPYWCARCSRGREGRVEGEGCRQTAHQPARAASDGRGHRPFDTKIDHASRDRPQKDQRQPTKPGGPPTTTGEQPAIACGPPTTTGEQPAIACGPPSSRKDQRLDRLWRAPARSGASDTDSPIAELLL